MKRQTKILALAIAALIAVTGMAAHYFFAPPVKTKIAPAPPINIKININRGGEK